MKNITDKRLQHLRKRGECMEEHYICTGSCKAVISIKQYNNGLKHCGAPQGCTMKGHSFTKCTHCLQCDHHVTEGAIHTCDK